jgi:hypothetical protein
VNNWPALNRFLRTDPRDPGCRAAMELLHVYTELAAADPGAAAQRYPGTAAHLGACATCAQDAAGLLAAVGADLTEP